MRQPPAAQINRQSDERAYRFDPVALKAWLTTQVADRRTQAQQNEAAGPSDRKGE
jgi:hypothetical protein